MQNSALLATFAVLLLISPTYSRPIVRPSPTPTKTFYPDQKWLNQIYEGLSRIHSSGKDVGNTEESCYNETIETTSEAPKLEDDDQGQQGYPSPLPLKDEENPDGKDFGMDPESAGEDMVTIDYDSEEETEDFPIIATIMISNVVVFMFLIFLKCCFSRRRRNRRTKKWRKSRKEALP